MIGAPTDVGASTRGASMGPEALRVAGLRDTLEAQGLEVLDFGNLSGPGNPCLPPVDGYRHLAEVTRWNQLVHDAVHGELEAGHLPILLGGDHSLAIGSISAVARYCRSRGRRLRVLWLDAHAADVTKLRADVGVGLRFVTPIGPAALDVGFNVTPDYGLNERIVAPHFTVGLF